MSFPRDCFHHATKDRRVSMLSVLKQRWKEQERKEEYKMQCNNEITAGGSVRDDIGKIDFLLRRI